MDAAYIKLMRACGTGIGYIRMAGIYDVEIMIVINGIFSLNCVQSGIYWVTKSLV